MEPDFEQVRDGNAWRRIRPEWTPWLREIEAPDRLAPAAEPREHSGRASHVSFRPTGAPARVFVRRYRRGGAVRRLGDRFLSPDRPFREWDILERACAAGLVVPRPIYAGAERRGLFWRLTLCTEELEGYTDALVFFREAAPRQAREAGRRIGEAFAGLLRAGIWHPDLHVRNVLVRLEGDTVRVALVDFDRASWIGPAAWDRRRRLLARFDRSLAKLDPRGYCLSRSDRLRIARAMDPPP